MPNAAAFFIKFRPMPPMPKIPRTLPCGSWPRGGGGEPLQWPARRASIAGKSLDVPLSLIDMQLTCIETSQSSQNEEHVHIRRSVVYCGRHIGNSDVMGSASMHVDLIVTSSYKYTSVPELLSIFDLNVPLWQMNFTLLGSAATTSSSINPVMETLGKVRYTATTLSKAPDLHSSRNSDLDLDLGSMTSAIEATDSSHSFFALEADGSAYMLQWEGG